MSELLNLIRDFFASLLTGDFKVSRKRRIMKNIYNELRQKNADYYRPHTNEVMPPFPEALFKWSRYIRALTELFEKTLYHPNSRMADLYKDHLVEARLEEKDRLKKADFTYAAMKERLAGAVSFKETLAVITQELNDYLALFRQPDFSGFDAEFAQLERLAALSRFPYEKLLSFFDPGTAVPDRAYQPRFSPVLAPHLTQELMDLYFIMAELDLGAMVAENLNRLYRRLKKVPADEEVDKINKIVSLLDILHRKSLSRQTLLCLIRLAGEDPELSLPTDRESPAVLELYKSKLLSRFELEREKLLREHSESEVSEDLKGLFGNTALLETRGYTADLSQRLQGAGFDVFLHLRSFQILKSFVVLFYETRIREHLKQLVIDAFFEKKAFKDQFIVLFHETQAIAEKIDQFETALCEPGEVSAPKVNEYLEKHTNGKTVAASLNQLVATINDNAARLLESAANTFSRFHDAFAELLADAKSHAPTIISNIKVIGGDRNPELMKQYADDREQIGRFIDIMKNFTIVRPRLHARERTH